MSEKSARVFLVVRRTWNVVVKRSFCEDGMSPNDEERVPVRGFATRKAAEVCCRELEAEAHRHYDVYPLFQERWGDEAFEAFFAVAATIGLPPRDETDYDWWERQQPVLTEEQRLALWDAVPESRIYEVEESTLED